MPWGTAGGVAYVAEAVAHAAEVLHAAGCDTPRLDAELLVADALGLDRGALLAHPELSVPPAAATVLADRVARRARREPLAHVLGRRGFRRLELAVDERVYVPRPETELLVEVALELPAGARVHDAGTGSGAVALAVKDERPDLGVSGSDPSPGAIEVARANAARLGLEVEFAVACPLWPGDYDLVTANLPYVRDDEWMALAPEITRYEPRDALLSGPDGLDAIRTLLASLAARTRVALEHAPEQASAVRALLAGAQTRIDLAGWERVTAGSAL